MTSLAVTEIASEEAPAPVSRWRIRYSKRHKLRFLGHRDVARVWERALRAAGVPIAMSAGFSPRPKMSFGLALPTGAESVAEYLDISVEGEVLADGSQLCERVAPVLPPGLTAVVADRVTPGSASLQEAVIASSWEFHIADLDVAELDEAVQRTLDAPELLVTRERKGVSHVDDIRPGVEQMCVLESSAWGDADGRPRVQVTLGHVGRGVRPGELVSALLPGAETATALVGVLRTHQWIEHDGARRELLPAAEASVDARGGTTWTPPTHRPGPTPERERARTVMTAT